VLKVEEWRKRGLSENVEERVRLKTMKRKKEGSKKLPWTWPWKWRRLQRGCRCESNVGGGRC
jgi:phage-related protein